MIQNLLFVFQASAGLALLLLTFACLFRRDWPAAIGLLLVTAYMLSTLDFPGVAP